MLLTLTTICVLLPILLKFYRYYRYYDAWKIPGPPGLPILGNVLDFGFSIEECFNSFFRITKQYGPYYRLWIGPFKLKVVLTDPNSVEQILNSNTHLDKTSLYNPLDWRLGVNLITSKASVWRKQRRLVQPTFHVKILDQFLDVFNSVSSNFVDALQKEATNGLVDVCPIAKRFSLDVICESVMGVKINALPNQNVEFVHASDTFMDQFIKQYFSVLSRFHWYYRFTDNYKQLQETLRIVEELPRKVIANRSRERLGKDRSTKEEFGVKNRKALLDFLLELQEDGGLTQEELNSYVSTFLLAGNHGPAAATMFTLFLAAKHPEMQQKLVEEIEAVMGTDEKNCTMKHLQEMNYLDRFVKESLRLYAPGVHIERTLAEDTQIGNYKLPKNTEIVIIPFMMHRDEKLFPNPEQFDPDRFLPENTANLHPYAYIPFSAGPRNCIAIRFAHLELKTALVHVLRRLELSAVVPEHQLRLSSDGVLKTLNGAPILIKTRQNQQFSC